jgi:hypothetical protein
MAKRAFLSFDIMLSLDGSTVRENNRLGRACYSPAWYPHFKMSRHRLCFGVSNTRRLAGKV